MLKSSAYQKNQLQKYEYGTDGIDTEKLQPLASTLSVPVQEFESSDTLPVAVEEKLFLDSYCAIPNKEIKGSILKITTSATKHSE